MILVRASGAGIKREGLLYFEKYGTGGPEFGIKEEFVIEKGRQLFHVRAWTGGKETTAPHDRTKTHYQRTTDWTKNILIFSTSKLTKTISPTVWLKLNLDFF